jgi:uncharacterized membrane protein
MNSESTLTRTLGWVSLGLGVAQLAAPRAVRRFAGAKDRPATMATVPLVGARELVHAATLVPFRRPSAWVCTRVAGDVLDLVLLARAARGGHRRRTAALAMAAVAGITAVDVYTALRTMRDRRSTRDESAIYLNAAITINCTPDEAYRFWRDFENLPSFMTHLDSVRVTGARTSKWKAKAPGGTVGWDAELTGDKPSELIGWRSKPGASVPNAGSVRFRPAPGGRGTEVRVELAYNPPAGRLGAIVARLLGENPEQQVRDDLRRFKQVMETGEVVRSEGSPEGTRAIRQATQRPARPGQLAPVIGGGSR